MREKREREYSYILNKRRQQSFHFHLEEKGRAMAQRALASKSVLSTSKGGREIKKGAKNLNKQTKLSSLKPCEIYLLFKKFSLRIFQTTDVFFYCLSTIIFYFILDNMVYNTVNDRALCRPHLSTTPSPVGPAPTLYQCFSIVISPAAPHPCPSNLNPSFPPLRYAFH